MEGQYTHPWLAHLVCFGLHCGVERIMLTSIEIIPTTSLLFIAPSLLRWTRCLTNVGGYRLQTSPCRTRRSGSVSPTRARHRRCLAADLGLGLRKGRREN